MLPFLHLRHQLPLDRRLALLLARPALPLPLLAVPRERLELRLDASHCLLRPPERGELLGGRLELADELLLLPDELLLVLRDAT